MKTTWQKDLRLPEHPELTESLSTEVIIIGGGITGITLSYLLVKSGKKVIVIDKDTLGRSVSAKTTAFLATDIDTDLPDLVKMFGKSETKEIWESHKSAIDTTERIIKEEKLDCEFVRVPEFLFATTHEGWDKLEEEKVLARRFGFNTEDLQNNALPFKNFGGYILPNQAKFHPLKYLGGLREKAEKLGVKFYENTEALSVTEGEKIKVVTEKGSIKADYAVIATYLPIRNPWQIFARKGIYYSYIYELEIPKGALPEGLYLDDKNPYHYFRVDKALEFDRMIIGGEDHRKELPMNSQKNFEALEDYVQKIFPKLKYRIITKWRGPILETIDGLPYIGMPDKNHPNMFVATGFSGNGMTYAMIAAKIIAGQILGRKDKYEKLYSPYRNQFTATGLWIKTCDYLGEFAGGYIKNVFRKVKSDVMSFDE